MLRTGPFVVPKTGRTFVAELCVLLLLLLVLVVVIKGGLFWTELDAVGDGELDGRDGFLAPEARMNVEVSVMMLVMAAVVAVVVLEVVVCVVVGKLEGERSRI